MNYTITSTWKTLSQIMGDNYSDEKQYRVHVNGDFNGKGIMSYTIELNPDANSIKSTCPCYSDVYFEENANPSLKSTIKDTNLDIDITEVA